MKHIKDILGERQLGLFATAPDKGGREWKAFNTVHGDRAGMFRVATPRKHEVPRYPNIVHISRQPRHFTTRFAR